MKMTACLLALCAVIPAAMAQAPDKVVVASDKRSQITVPASWDTLQLNEAAEIQVGNETDEAYLIVLTEIKEDLAGWNLEKHSRVTLGKLLSSLSFPAVTGPKPMTIDGHPAVQYEIRAASGGRNIFYLHTTIDGGALFSQVLAWTLPSHLDAVRPQLVKAVGTYHEVK